MTTTAPTDAHDDLRSRRSLALDVRRWALVASPVLAAVFTAIGLAADPAPGINGRDMYEIYGEQPGPLQWKALGLHYGYAFFIVPGLLVTHLVRARGAWLANLAAALGFVGLSTLPGLLFVDYYDSAISELYGPEGAIAVSGEMEQMWGVIAFAVPGMVASLAAPIVAGLALWRAGLVRWWAPVAVLASFLAFDLWGGALMALALCVFAVELARATQSRLVPLQ